MKSKYDMAEYCLDSTDLIDYPLKFDYENYCSLKYGVITVFHITKINLQNNYRRKRVVRKNKN